MFGVDQAEELRKLAREKNSGKGEVITITSGKGGVGKTFFSINLGMLLARRGKKVLLFDGDLALGNLNVALGIVPKYHLHHVIKRKKKLKEIILKLPEGMDLIAAPSGYAHLAHLEEKEREYLLKALGDLPPYDYIFIDTAAGIGANVVDFSLPADRVIVVTTPEPTAIADAYGIIKALVLRGIEAPIQLVVNRAQSILEARKVAHKIREIAQQFLEREVEELGYILEDPSVPLAIRRQKPLIKEFPRSKSVGCLESIAGNILHEEASSQGGGLLGFFQRFFKRV